MIPVMQTKRGGPDVPPDLRGDCLSACLASLLEVPIEEVSIPHSDRPEIHWWDTTQEALEPHGYRLVVGAPKVWPDTWWVAGVPSLNHGPKVRHMVVMRSAYLAHDPALGLRYTEGAHVGTLVVQDAYVLAELAPRSRRSGSSP